MIPTPGARAATGLWLVAALGLACGPPASNPGETPADFADTPRAEPVQRGDHRKQSDAFSNILLHTQHGEPVRFYDDLVKDKVVIINLIYTTCPKICPATTAQLAKVNDSLAPWIGKDVTMLSISIDPEVDSPERLKRYWELFGSKPGWLFLTGDYDEIDQLRHELGVYDLDPVIDADKTQHGGIVTFGNDRTNRWSALPALMHRRLLAKTILQITWDDQWKTTARRAKLASQTPDTYSGRGIVRAIHPQRGEVVIEHEDIPGLMLAMTMPFEVADPALLEGLSPGQTVDFVITLEAGIHRVVSLAPAAGPAAPRNEAATTGPARALASTERRVTALGVAEGRAISVSAHQRGER